MSQSRARFHAVVSLFAAALMLMSGLAQAQPAGPVTQVAAGYSFACALTTVGGVACWGANASGQLGDESTTPVLFPVAVSGLSAGVVAITTGQAHAGALTTAGGVKCWGENSSGQLGNRSTLSSSAPTDVSGLNSSLMSEAGSGIAGGASNALLSATDALFGSSSSVASQTGGGFLSEISNMFASVGGPAPVMAPRAWPQTSTAVRLTVSAARRLTSPATWLRQPATGLSISSPMASVVCWVRSLTRAGCRFGTHFTDGTVQQ